MRFFSYIYIFWYLLPATVGQAQDSVLNEDSTHIPDVHTEINNSNPASDLPASLAVFVHLHLLSNQFELQFSPDVDLIAQNISNILPDKAYTVIFENERREMPYTAMATLFPTTQKASFSERKKACHVEFSELLESYELKLIQITSTSGSVETSIFWKKLPGDAYESVLFRWLPSADMKYDRNRFTLSAPEFSENQKDVSIDIYDHLGKRVKTPGFQLQEGTISMPLDQLNHGNYVVVLKLDSITVFARSIELGSI